MVKSLAAIAIGLAVSLASPTFAAGPGASVVGSLRLAGHVDMACTAGTLSSQDNIFNVGVLVDVSTDYLLSSLTAPTKTLVGASCGPKSAISITATPMTAQNYHLSLPAGFSKASFFFAFVFTLTLLSSCKNQR